MNQKVNLLKKWFCIFTAFFLAVSDVGNDTGIRTVQAADVGTEWEAGSPDYTSEEAWAYNGIGTGERADVFLVCPTVDTRSEYNMSVTNEKMRSSFLNALEMERGIYEKDTRLFAPYYRQASLKVYEMGEKEREPYLENAYEDVSKAFRVFLEQKNENRPIILAGFSQGADMCYRLMEEYFGDQKLQERLVAVYAIGWACTDAMTKQYPQIKPAQGEADTGVVVSFDCEAETLTKDGEAVSGTVIHPAGQKAYSINPLNWKTDGTPADKSLNKGACFLSGSEITSEIKGLCGCYIDTERNALKVTDVSVEDYPAVLSVFPDGAYHIYDYQFFYRNLQENVSVRLAAYEKSKDQESGDSKPSSEEKTASAKKAVRIQSVSAVKGQKKITGTVSVKNAAVKIKIGKEGYKNAAVNGKKFTLKGTKNLKKGTKIVIIATKKGYERAKKTVLVK